MVYREGSHALHSGDRCLCGFLTHTFQGSGSQSLEPLRGCRVLSDGSGDPCVTAALSADELNTGFHRVRTSPSTEGFVLQVFSQLADTKNPATVTWGEGFYANKRFLRSQGLDPIVLGRRKLQTLLGSRLRTPWCHGRKEKGLEKERESKCVLKFQSLP